MSEIKYKKVSLEYMFQQLLNEILNSAEIQDFYWYHEDNGFHQIVECDLMRGRFITDDGDFSEFSWEIADSHIYIEDKNTI